MNEDQDEIPRERATPTNEEIEAIRRTDRAILDNKRGANTPDVFIPKKDYMLLLDYLQRDVNLFMCPETGAIIFRGASVFWDKETI